MSVISNIEIYILNIFISILKHSLINLVTFILDIIFRVI